MNNRPQPSDPPAKTTREHTDDKPAAREERVEHPDADERIDEAIDESFPASDPPSYNKGVKRSRTE